MSIPVPPDEDVLNLRTFRDVDPKTEEEILCINPDDLVIQAPPPDQTHELDTLEMPELQEALSKGIVVNVEDKNT